MAGEALRKLSTSNLLNAGKLADVHWEKPVFLRPLGTLETEITEMPSSFFS